MEPLLVYYVPSCAFSCATIAFLVARGADFEVVNLDEHPELRNELEERLQNQKLETPTLEAGGVLHVAPALSELKRWVHRLGLPDDAAPHQKLKEAER